MTAVGDLEGHFLDAIINRKNKREVSFFISVNEDGYLQGLGELHYVHDAVGDTVRQF